MINTIDTRHGTSNKPSFSNGNCLPYTGVPFGMNYFAPQTSDQEGSWWFHPDLHTFQGFRITHQPSPWMGDFSHFMMTPISGAISQLSPYHFQSSYRPEEAIFNPAKLKITSTRYQLQSTLIPTMYGGSLTIESKKENNGLVLTLPGIKSVFELINDQCLHLKLVNYSGCEDEHFSYYVSIHFEHPFALIDSLQVEDTQYVQLQLSDHSIQELRVATSFISFEQAELNYERDKRSTSQELWQSCEEQWMNYLNRIEVTHHDPEHTKTFYHNMYRTFLFPQTFYERNQEGKAIHYDTFNQKVQEGVMFTNNGFWDTYKTVYPLFSLIAVEEYNLFLEGFLNSYLETGFLPKWLSPDERGLMPGTLIDAVIADAAAKNIRLDLMPQFLEAMKKSATIQSSNENYGRQGTYDYLNYGYVPSSYHESVNHTLDYAYSDFCISKVAEYTGDSEVAFYQKQSLNYKNIFDNTIGLMRAKDENGVFRKDFSPHRWGKDYAEGSAYQSSFAVFHDFKGLIDCYPDKTTFVNKLIELFNQEPNFEVEGYGFEIHEMSEMAAIDFGQMAISNQPSFHLPFLFHYVGQPYMAQPLLKNLMTECFDATKTGYPGDEDNGSLSAWYLFNSLGFYPVTPGSGEYVIGMPLITSANIHLASGSCLTIQAAKNAPQHQFISSVKRNNQDSSSLYFTHSDLLTGGTIDYTLGIVPNPKTYLPEQLPFSLSTLIKK